MKKLKNYLFLMALFLVASVSAFGQGQSPNWTCNPNAHQMNMVVYVQLVVEDVEIKASESVPLAAFVGDECRGVATVLRPNDDYEVYQLFVYSDKAGEEITLKTIVDGNEITIPKAFTFKESNIEGDGQYPSTPLVAKGVKYIPGDVDGNGKIELLDITTVIDYFLGKKPSNFVFPAADIDGNGKIELIDVTEVISLFLKN